MVRRRSLLGLVGAIFSVATVSQCTTKPDVIRAPSGSLLTTATSAMPLKTATPKSSVKPSAPPRISGSAPTQIYLPRLGVTIDISDVAPVCPVTTINGEPMLDPDRSNYTKACYFVDRRYPYALPGTNALDLAVLAGHTSRQFPSAFNVFYDWQNAQFTVRKGDELWLKTAESGGSWLVYTATDLLTPKKYAASGSVSLMDDPSVWGTAPTPGVLLTIGCLQPQDLGQRSSKNFVIKWRFTRVVK